MFTLPITQYSSQTALYRLDINTDKAHRMKRSLSEWHPLNYRSGSPVNERMPTGKEGLVIIAMYDGHQGGNAPVPSTSLCPRIERLEDRDLRILDEGVSRVVGVRRLHRITCRGLKRSALQLSSTTEPRGGGAKKLEVNN